MTSVQNATGTHYCKQPNCTNEASSPVGRYSYCKEHQGASSAKAKPPPHLGERRREDQRARRASQARRQAPRESSRPDAEGARSETGRRRSATAVPGHDARDARRRHVTLRRLDDECALSLPRSRLQHINNPQRTPALPRDQVAGLPRLNTERVDRIAVLGQQPERRQLDLLDHEHRQVVAVAHPQLDDTPGRLVAAAADHAADRPVARRELHRTEILAVACNHLEGRHGYGGYRP